MSYVDGFLLAVPKKKLAEYRSFARRAGKIWRGHGALQYIESVGDDMDHKGMAVSFNKRAAAKPGEIVVFSWILFKSRKDRDRVNALVMTDPRMLKMMATMKDMPQPFDMKRMAYGGFKVIVEL